jgi:hypothetical protein
MFTREMTMYLWQMYTLLPMAFWKIIGTTSPLQFFCVGNVSLEPCPASVSWLATQQRWHLGTSEVRLQEVMQLH